MSNWPSTLPPSPLINGFGRQKRSAKQEFQPEGGTSKPVVFYTAVPDVLDVRFLINNDQRETLNNFYENELLFGTQSFNFTDPQSGQTEIFRFIGGPPDYSPQGPFLFVVSFTLEKQP